MSDVYDWSDTFVSIGIAVVIAAGLIGGLVHRPGGERIIAALESGDRAAAARDGKKGGDLGNGDDRPVDRRGRRDGSQDRRRLAVPRRLQSATPMDM